MVAVDVDVENSGVGSEEFEDSKDDIVDITKPRGFAAFGVVQTSGPVYSDIRCPRSELLSGVDATTSGDGAKFENAFKRGVVLSY